MSVSINSLNRVEIFWKLYYHRHKYVLLQNSNINTCIWLRFQIRSLNF